MRQWTVDAFASRPFMGNGACVVEPQLEWRDEAWMQALARENNLSETAFLIRTDRPDRFGLRWFTPGREVDLCGHATLASAHVLLGELGLDVEAVTFETRSGPLIVKRGQGRDAYEMDFPADAPRRAGPVAGLAEALGAEPVEVWAARYLVVMLKDADTVRSLTPDIAALNALVTPAGEPGEVIVCAPADDGDPYDVVDRFFAPGCGVPEDPATGSAHCILAPLWTDRLGRARVDFFQAFPTRGGAITTEMRGDRVILTGQAVTTVESRLRV